MSGLLYSEYGRSNPEIQKFQNMLNQNKGGYRVDERGIKNILNVRNQIDQKLQAMQNGQLYYPTVRQIKGTVVDVDSFPYTRMSRNDVFGETSTVWEREAGWHPIMQGCNTPIIESSVVPPPQLCYQTSCTLTQPCIPKYLQAHSSSAKMETMLNNQCLEYLYQ
jgi:hypothetical protein